MTEEWRRMTEQTREPVTEQTRRRMSESQRRRWAARRAAQDLPATTAETVSIGPIRRDDAPNKLQFSISIRTDMAEFATWRPECIRAFLQGVAAVLAAQKS